MEEVYCPLCGKPNPLENKFCDYCLAHLKPVEDPMAGETTAPVEEETTSGSMEQESRSDDSEWMRSQQQPEPEKSDERDEQEPEMEKSPESIPDWISGLSRDEGDEYPDQTDGLSEFEGIEQEAVSQVDPFILGQGVPSSQDIPGWLDEALTEDEPQVSGGTEFQVEPEPEEDDRVYPLDDLPQAEPVQEPKGSSESTGPLAGLKGVLSAEPAVARARKAGTYSAKLRISANQRTHVDLLKSLIDQEDQPQPLPQRRAISQQHVFRWVITLVLFLVVLWPLVTASQASPFPANEEGSAETHRLVSQLPENARVLVGFDFEPGLAAEIDATAFPVMEHLIRKGAFLTLVSTSPQGPILAERFMSSAQNDIEDIEGFQYVNLGYIPGGAAGLLSFIENPQRTMPYALDGVSAWGTDSVPALNGINKITDYSMVILLVDDPDTARVWIEQMGPRINEPEVFTSFVLLTSAQLEAMVLPYYESIPRMVNGMVVGLRGGAAYARITGRGDLPRQYWDAFGLGTSFAALLILIGGLGYYVIPELTRSPQAQGKAK
jgi:hypothetical protein